MTQVNPGSTHVPDILDCLAQLSNSAVPTPPKLARAMLDLLPDEVWSDPDLKWLDPFSKSGVFLREVATRLFDGLAEWEPDFVKRREHIFRNMLHGAAITEMTGIISRRSVYCAADASGTHSVVRFADSQGNLPFVPAEHDFDKKRTCKICRAPEALVREGREDYAYSFIHGTYPTKEMADMKFDVIVGNPPYQIGMEGADGKRTANITPLYHLFVDTVLAMEPRYAVMITPSRWFTGGKGLDAFRASMIADRRLAKLVDNPKLFDCFPGVEIKGGVSYFLWDRAHDGDCEFSTRVNGVILSTMTRDLREGEGVLVRDNKAASIIAKARSAQTLAEVVSPRDPFGQKITTNFAHASVAREEGMIPLVFASKVEYVTPDQLQRNHGWVDRWKVLIPKAGDGHGREVSYVLGEPIALSPGSACTQSYLVAGTFSSREKSENYAHFLVTKFVRFLVLQRKVTQDLTPERFRFAPMLDMTRRWTDEDLYGHFNLTDEEREYVEATIAPRAVNLTGLDSDDGIPTSHLPGGSKYRAGAVVDDMEDEE